MASRIRNILTMEPTEQTVTVEGWVKTKRDSKNLTFLEITDGSSFRGIQVIVDHDAEGTFDHLDAATTGSSVRIKGKLVASPGKNQSVEVQATQVDIIGEAPADSYPLQKKRHSFEFLREIAHLRPRTNTFGAVTRVRNALSFAIHRFFQEQGFMYIHTPIISASDCEGAGEMFQVTTLPMEKLPTQDGAVDYSRDFFGKQASLTVSGQLEAEIYALAMRDVYTFGPTFRAENSNTSRHLAEFWMIEPEMAFCTLEGDMELAEEFIKYILKYVLDHCPEDMDFFSKWIEKGVKESIQQVVDSKFQHVTYSKAVELLEKADRSFEYPIGWGEDLQSEHERYLTEEVFKGPVIVTDYPKEIKAFYMKLNEDNKTVRAMDVLVPRLGEIIGGSEREDHYDTLLKRIEEMNLNPEDYWWYLDLRRYGSVPHSGFGLGFERLVQYVTGMHNIRDVIPFPRTVKNAEF
ncbi:MAG: asparagine--tRNA ligase [Spirochaetaceae bacterium]|nr:asparagine--tRNA ligase [Spirochaetaceae bacterium]MCF7947072.1 asparagine--tRNA ligase [Spirochaetia bacterium]MCF7950073.1 asparagine--tRNA ligase [Spirochaetaceae bacterium]